MGVLSELAGYNTFGRAFRVRYRVRIDISLS